MASLLTASAAVPTIAEKTEGLEPRQGFLPLYWDAGEGKMWLEIPRPGDEFLYIESLAAGIGSNDIGLDRGQIGRERLVRFDRTGPKVLLVQPNYRYRAISDDPAERESVADSFAQSVIWGFELGAEEDGRLLVDATGFLLHDAHGTAERLKQTEQGNYELDPPRSAFHLANTRNFPDNTEVEATLTFTGKPEGEYIRSVTPSPESVTVRQHHSFVRLPGPGFEPRRFDPRAGYFGIRYRDYAAPLGSPIDRRYIARHRLEKRDPRAEVSEPVEPIVYYLDPGVPEPVRSALLDGARWWAEAFEALGFRNAYRVELLPEDADPMDVRYNVIQWVHRSTRGWSYGSSVIDPRTGEIIKGKVSLGSLRVRQDYLIAEALLAPYAGGEPPTAMREMALARLRQLSAHEVGHTLGLAHNYIASTTDRASVMDYPHPFVKLDESGEIDLSDAYATGIGEWDKVSIAYGYQDFPDGTGEAEPLARILDEARDRGLTLLSDADARPDGSAHPRVHLWDNGVDAVAELDRLMEVRRRALERFSERNIQFGEPLATLEERLVPLYLAHRYQTTAAAKVVGGVEYAYSLRGDGQPGPLAVPADAQQRALEALLVTIGPEALTLPERILALVPPRPMGYPRHRETFPSRTGPTFDPLAAAEAAADHTVGLLLHRERASRLVTQHARDPELPGLPRVFDRLVRATLKRVPREDGLAGEVQRVVDNVVIYHLMALAADDQAPPQARADATEWLEGLGDWLQTDFPSAAQTAHARRLARAIERFLEDPAKITLPRPLTAPPGQPI